MKFFVSSVVTAIYALTAYHWYQQWRLERIQRAALLIDAQGILNLIQTYQDWFDENRGEPVKVQEHFFKEIVVNQSEVQAFFPEVQNEFDGPDEVMLNEDELEGLRRLLRGDS